MKGFVYIFVNSAFPNLIKIGRTTKLPEERAIELSGTGTPSRFIPAFSVYVENCIEIENEMHELLENYRYEKNREFFETNSTHAINLLQKISANKITQFNEIFNEEDENDKESIYSYFYISKLANYTQAYRIGFTSDLEYYIYSHRFKLKLKKYYAEFDIDIDINEIDTKATEFVNLPTKKIINFKEIINKEIQKFKNKNKFNLFNQKYDKQTFILKGDRVYNNQYSLIMEELFITLKKKLTLE